MAQDSGGSLRKRKKDRIGKITSTKHKLKLGARQASQEFKEGTKQIVEKTGRRIMKDPVVGAAIVGGAVGGAVGGPVGAVMGAGGAGAGAEVIRQYQETQKEIRSKRRGKRLRKRIK